MAAGRRNTHATEKLRRSRSMRATAAVAGPPGTHGAKAEGRGVAGPSVNLYGRSPYH